MTQSEQHVLAIGVSHDEPPVACSRPAPGIVAQLVDLDLLAAL
jgi:hypothetical protein